MPDNKYTLITGASSGLGKEFAIQCARKGMNIILIALPGSRLQSMAENLELEYRICVKVFEFDLSDSDVLKQQLQLIIRDYPINFLINNAGIGGTSSITHTSLERIDEIMMLNVRSTVLLTHLLIPHLLKHPQSYIMNIASMAAFTPIAYKTVYPASKAFISSFFLGLKEELADTSVSVSVVYPGPIMTNSHTSRRIISQGLKGKMGLLSTPDIADIALRGTLAGHPVIIPGWMNKLNHILMQLLPLSFRMRIVSREVKKEIPYSLSV
ncbi:SDR family NAD(P)-dependent oxidoreductase [Chitinophaga sp. ARDCPP14]|uniref:SDR family NAD(P)-dependent oxidoreductase n=1 Tax=Chitinophaga sp. ARDCPP14 TaxID=3391139 RepID=UPI003F526C3A